MLKNQDNLVLWRLVAKLIYAPTCYCSSLGSNPDIPQKYKMGRQNKQRSGQNTLARQKIYKKITIKIKYMNGERPGKKALKKTQPA